MERLESRPAKAGKLSGAANTRRVGVGVQMFATHMCVERSAIAAGVRAGHSLHCTRCRENEGRDSRWPFARPASRGLARGGGAAPARTPRPLRRPRNPPSRWCRLAFTCRNLQNPSDTSIDTMFLIGIQIPGN